MKERVIALLIVLCMLFCMGAIFAMPAAAAEEKIEIATAEELAALAGGDLSANYILKADIDLTDVDYTPIGDVDAPFTGVFDGNGYVIRGLQLESDGQFQGLFGVNNGTIRNVTLAEDCVIYGSAHVGAIAGRNNGTIENCISRATVGHYSAAEANGNTYSVMSQNLCQWGDDDLTAYDDYVDSTVHSRRPPMIKRIRNADPDILLFQEVSFDVHHKNGIDITSWNDYLRAQLTDYTFFGMYRSDTDFEGILVAYKTEKFNLIDEDIFWLSEDPDGPRSIQKVTKNGVVGNCWDASHVRTCHWVLVEDKENGQKLAAYSTHLDVGGAIARENGGRLIAERMELLAESYPDALFFVGGDFNETPGKPGYTYIDNAFNGFMDDGRYMAENRLNNWKTHGPINDLVVTGEHQGSIDFIFTDSSKAEVETFWVMDDNYDGLRPSDHQGVFITARAMENNYVGGIAGSNNGTISKIIADGTFSGDTAEGYGAVLGANDYNAKVRYIYAADPSQENMIGETFEVQMLPETPSQEVTNDLSAKGGIFEFADGEYRIVKGCGEKNLVKIIVNGENQYVFAGSLYTLDMEIPEGAIVYLDGEPFSGSSIIVPPEGFKLSVAVPASQVSGKVSAGDFTVSDIEEWMYVYENAVWFAQHEVTIHLLCDIDLSDPAAEGFEGFTNPAFSFEGHGNTISNWGSREEPAGVSLFRVTKGAGGMKYIRNLEVVNCHVAGSNSAVLYAPTHANGGLQDLPTEFSVTNVTLNGCSMASSGQSSGLLVSRYGSTGMDFTVNIKNCRLLNSYVDANHSEHVGLLIGKLRSTDEGTGTFNLSDCYLVGNRVVNTIQASGFICGNAEANTKVNISNIGLFNNIGSGTEFSYICANNGTAPKITVDGIMIAGNQVTADKSYLFGSMTSDFPAVGTHIFSDAEVTAYRDGIAVEYTPDAAPLLSGEAGHIVNGLLEEPSFYWAKDEKSYFCPASNERVRKVTLRDGSTEQIQYLNNGSILALDAPALGGWFIAEGSSTLSENQLSVASDTVAVVAKRTSEVSSAVGSGDYTIEDLADWMALYENLSFFQNQKVTIHLLCNIDLSAAEAADFNGFIDPAFSLDGHEHTVSNWGSEEEPINQRAMFVVKNGSYGMGYVKNLNLSDCHVAYDGHSVAVLYSVAQGNGGLEGLPTNFTLENIHIDFSSVVGMEATSLLLSRYGVTNADFTVNIRNCSVQNSKVDGNNESHSGLLIGKPREAGGACTFNISDCYLYNNAITNGVNGVGFVFGTAEGGKTTINMENVGIVDNFLSTTDAGAYIGYGDYSGAGSINLTNMILQGNTVEAGGVYLVGSHPSAVKAVTLSGVYSDIENLTGAVEQDPSVSYQSKPAQIATGEAAYLLNQAIGDAAIYWQMKDGKVAAADREYKTVKISLSLPDGTPVQTLYGAGGAQIDLTLKKDPEATFDALGKAEISENLLTVPVGGEDLNVLVNSTNPDAYLPNFRAPVTTVTEPVYEGTYTVNSVEEWMYLFKKPSYFASPDITIVLGADIDLSDEKAAEFTGFSGTRFSLDGNGKTVKNWSYRNQDSKNYGCGLFSEFLGKSIKNLTIENFDLSGDYGRAILISGYAGVEDLTIENVHVKGSVIDACNSGNQMAVMLSRPMYAAPAAGATITLKNCSVINSDMTASGGARINNSGLLFGSAYNGFSYVVENCLIQDCAVETGTGAGGMVIGAIEASKTEVTLDRVAIFDSTAKMASTNELPGVFAGEIAAGSLTMKNCLAADLSAEGQEGVALLKHSKTNISIDVSNCFTDFEPLELVTTNNSEGIIAENLGAVEGVTQLSSAAFKSGEAAWRANDGASDSHWRVDESFNQYPAFSAKEGYAAPFRVTFEDTAFYTNSNGLLPADAESLLEKEGGLWVNGEELVTSATVYTADTALTFELHNFPAENAVPDGEGFHKIPCSDDGCMVEKRISCRYTHTVVQREEEGIHGLVCVCGNSVDAECEFTFVSMEDGSHFERCNDCLVEKESASCVFTVIPMENDLHFERCDDCGYEKAAESCSYTYTHVAETDTHIGECDLCKRSLAAESCTFDPEGIIPEGQEPSHDQAGKRFFYCTADCGHYQSEALPRLAQATLELVAAPLAMADEKYEVQLLLKGNTAPGLNGLTAVLTYNAKALSLSKPELDVWVEGFEAEVTNEVSGDCGTLTIVARSAEAITAEEFAIVAFTPTQEAQHAGEYAMEIALRDAYLGAKEQADPASEPLNMQSGDPVPFRLHFSLAGDVNCDADVTISDVVVLLRVINGSLSLDQIDVEAANLYIADGFTQNGGITTADAIEVLKLVLP